VICPYCGKLAKLKDSTVVYGQSYGNIYLCTGFPECDSYVGVHKGTNKPLGPLANKPLRELRKQCHKAFDLLWKGQKLTRRATYQWLRIAMKMTRSQAHIGQFNEVQCRKLLTILRRGNV
jgi:hypothetical protein